MFIAETDSLGNRLWSQTISNDTTFIHGKNITITQDGCIVVYATLGNAHPLNTLVQKFCDLPHEAPLPVTLLNFSGNWFGGKKGGAIAMGYRRGGERRLL